MGRWICMAGFRYSCHLWQNHSSMNWHRSSSVYRWKAVGSGTNRRNLPFHLPANCSRCCLIFLRRQVWKALIMGITQPVVNFLLAKLALNAEIYICTMIGRRVTGSVRRGRDLMVRTADGACSLRAAGRVRTTSGILNAWEVLYLLFANRLADEGCSLEEDEIFNSSVRYQMPEDALLMDEGWFCSASTTSQTSFRFRYADVLLMKAEAMERNDGDGRAEYNMVRACRFAYAQVFAAIWKTVGLCWRAKPVTVRTHPFRQVPSSPRIFVLFSPFSRPFHRLPDTSAGALPSMVSWFRTKWYGKWNSLHPISSWWWRVFVTLSLFQSFL